MEHTHGQWEAYENDIFDNDMEKIACVFGEIVGPEKTYIYTDKTYANARLIAAAPDLLYALVKYGNPPIDWACKNCAPHSDIIVPGFLCKYHSVIAKVKGK